MVHASRSILTAGVIALAILVAGCSSSQDRTPQGSLALAWGASRAPAGRAATVSADDPVELLNGASTTVAHVEARRTDGSWVPIDAGLPAAVDLLAAANDGRTVTLSPDLLPEGQYNALQLRMTKVELTRRNGHRVTIAPKGAGWTVLIPVDFGVVGDEATIVALNVRLDHSFELVNGEFEFDPEVEVTGVRHD